MTPAQNKKRREAAERELREWNQLLADAKARCDNISDPAELAEALRGYLLAKADLHEFHWPTHPVRGLPVTAMWRRRANDPGYRAVLAGHWLMERALKTADQLTGLDDCEKGRITKLDEDESAAFVQGLNAWVNSICVKRR